MPLTSSFRGSNVVHAWIPAAQAEWQKLAESLYPKFKATMVPPDLFDDVERLRDQYRKAHGIPRGGPAVSDTVSGPPTAPAAPGKKSNPWHIAEDTLSVIAFSLMTVLPVVAMTVRLLRLPDLPESAAIVQQLTLFYRNARRGPCGAIGPSAGHLFDGAVARGVARSHKGVHGDGAGCVCARAPCLGQ